MSDTPQTQAVGIANQLIAIAVNLAAQKTLIDQYTAQYTQLTLGTTYAAMPTCATNADGSLGAADSAPTSGHVIDSRVVSQLTRAISAADLGSLVTLLQAISALLAGSAVSQQGQGPQILAKVTGV